MAAREAWGAASEWSLVAAALGLGAALVFVVVALELPQLNADGQHTHLLMRDLIERRGDVIWQCTTNFYFFPALLFVALGQAFFDDLGLVHLTSFAAQALAVAGAGAVYARVAAPAAPARRWLLAGASLGCLYLAAMLQWPFFASTGFNPTSHGMHFPVAIALFAAFLADITQPSRKAAASFVVLGTLLLLSDVIFVVWLLAPLAIASFVAFALLRREGRQLARATLLIGTPFFASLAAKVAVEATGRFDRRTRSGAHGAAEVHAAFLQFLGDLPRIEGALALACLAALGLLAGGALLLAVRRPRLRAALALRLDRLAISRLLWMTGILVAGLLTSLAAPLLTGAWEGESSARYFANVVLLPLLWATHVALAASGPGRPAPLRAFALVSLLLGAALGLPARGAFELSRVRAPYPAEIAALDALAERDGLRFGLSDYWQANSVRALSRRGLVVVAVHPNLFPYVWSTSVDPYFATDSFDFVILERLDRDAVLRRLGAPRRIERAGAWEVWLYDRVRDAPRFAYYHQAAIAAVRRRGLMLRDAWVRGPQPASGSESPRGERPR